MATIDDEFLRALKAIFATLAAGGWPEPLPEKMLAEDETGALACDINIFLLRCRSAQQDTQGRVAKQNSARITGPMSDESGSDSEIAAIAGLDTKLALKGVMGKQSVYLEMLRRFLNNQSTAPAAIRQSLQAGDRMSAERLVHTAKEICGNIGASALQAEAAHIEALIREGAPTEVVMPRLDVLAQAHAALVTQLRSLFQSAADATPSEALERNKIADVCNRLMQHLASDDSKAHRLIRQERSMLQTLLGTERFTQFERAASQFDFEAAFGILKAGVAVLKER